MSRMPAVFGMTPGILRFPSGGVEATRRATPDGCCPPAGRYPGGYPSRPRGGPDPTLAALVGLALGLLVLNLVGMLLTDFFLGLAAFHVLVGVAALGGARRLRWAGAGLLALTLALGALT